MEIVYEFDGRNPTIAKTPDTVHSFRLIRDHDHNDQRICGRKTTIPVPQVYGSLQRCDNMDPDKVELSQRSVACGPNLNNFRLKTLNSTDFIIFFCFHFNLPSEQCTRTGRPCRSIV